MPLRVFLLLYIFARLTPVFAQTYFEGELDYRNAFIDKQSFQRLYEDILQTVTIKGGKYKLNVNQKNKINWQIDDFENGHSYEYRNFGKPRTVIQNDTIHIVDTLINATISVRDSISIRKDTSNVHRIFERQLCWDSTKFAKPKNYTGLRMLDTMIVVAGMNCHIMEDIKDGFRSAEYYYFDSIKINPLQYNCFRVDGDDRLYKFTNGSLITKRILYDTDDYIYVLELVAIRPKEISDEVFELPKEIEVVPVNKQ
ncbi:MAG: hypothetical protein JWN78_1103 [Bacteroidota bacterium]|nr:hypothetical protein [Bacteroidota bacterium]